MSRPSGGHVGPFFAVVAGISLMATALAAPVAGADPQGTGRSGHAISRGHVDAAAAAREPVVRLPAIGQPPHRVRDGFVAPKGPMPDRAAASETVTSLAPAASPKSVREFGGITEADTVGVEPPDPWVAVSPSFVLQSTNGVVRISDRGGRMLQTLPVESLFALYPHEYGADPRILWDQGKGRWVGVLLSFPGDRAQNFLNIAVSETSDPTGGWNVWAFEYYLDGPEEPTLPDYPGIASSTDKVVITANEFQGGTYIGASVLVLRWTDLLNSADPRWSLWTVADDTLWTIRPAQVLSSSADVHLIAVDNLDGVNNGSLLHAKVTGSGTSLPVPTWTDLEGVLPDFLFTVPAPRQAGDPATISDAADGRPTDAVWRSNRLWIASTYAATYDAGSTYQPAARIIELSTSTAVPTLLADTLLGTTSEADTFMPGIGVSGNGTAFAVYSRSSATEPVSIQAAVDTAGTDWSAPIEIEVGDGPYTMAAGRWGDYAGVAKDPSGDAAVWQTHEVAAKDGTWRTVVSRLLLDATPPIVFAPSQELIKGTAIGRQTVPVRVKWAAGTDTGSGIAEYCLAVNLYGAGFGEPARVTGTSVVRNHNWKSSSNAGDIKTHAYRLSALDDAGNLSPSLNGATLTPVVYQQTSATYSTGWRTSKSSSFLGGSAKYSSTAGKSASFRTSGRSFGFVSYRNSTRGKVKVYVDGKYKATVKLRSSTTRARYIAYVASYATSGTHTIKLVVVSGRVDVDAFVVLK